MSIVAVGTAYPSFSRKVTAFAENAPKANTKKVKFSVKQRIDFGKQIAVVGSKPALGSWDPAAGVHLSWNEDDVWAADVQVPVAEPLELKFVIIDDKKVHWPPGDNLVLSVPDDVPEVVVEASGLWNGASVVIKPIVAPKEESTASTTNGPVAIKNEGEINKINTVPDASSKGESAIAASSTVPSPAAAAPPSLISAAAKAPVSAIQVPQELQKLTIPKLKAMATEMGLKTSGKKAELVARIEAALAK